MGVKAVVTFRAHKGKGVALLAALTLPLEATRGNSDCLDAGLFMGAQSPDELVLLDEWEGQESHVAHMAALEKEGALEEVTPLLEEPPQTTYYQKTG